MLLRAIVIVDRVSISSPIFLSVHYSAHLDNASRCHPQPSWHNHLSIITSRARNHPRTQVQETLQELRNPRTMRLYSMQVRQL